MLRRPWKKKAPEGGLGDDDDQLDTHEHDHRHEHSGVVGIIFGFARSAFSHAKQSLTTHHSHHHHHHHHHHGRTTPDGSIDDDDDDEDDGAKIITKKERLALVRQQQREREECEEAERAVRGSKDDAATADAASSRSNSQTTVVSSSSSTTTTLTEETRTKAAAKEKAPIFLKVMKDYKGPGANRRFVLSTLRGRDAQSQCRIGKLSVRVVEAANLPGVLFSNVGDAPTSNPYCVLSLEGRAWRTKTKSRDLNPRFYEDATFYVHRHDATLRVEIFDEGEHHDDRLGLVSIDVSKLAGHFDDNTGRPVARWFRVKSHLDWTSSAVLLQLSYDVNYFGEAISMLWLDPPKPKPPPPPFDVNEFYKNAMAFRKETAPYLGVVDDVFAAVKWRESANSAVWLFCAYTIAFYWHKVFAIFHASIAYASVRHLYRRSQRKKLEKAATEIFARIDSDNSNTLSRAEVSICFKELVQRIRLDQIPTEADIDDVFQKYAKSNGKELTLPEFIDTVCDFPEFVGDYRTAYEADLPLESDSLDGVLDDDIDGGTATASSSGSSKSTDVAIRGKLAKKVLNTVGRRVSFLAYASRQFGGLAKDLAFVRKVLEWDKNVSKDLSKACLAGNVFLCLLHHVLPTTYLIFIVSGAFFYYSEKRILCERAAKVGKRALRRYRGLVAKDPTVIDNSILVDDGRPVLHDKIRVGDVRSKALQSVVRGVFSRIDRDADGRVDVQEFLSFVLAAIPRAAPSISRECHDHAPTKHDVEKNIRQVMAEFSTSSTSSSSSSQKKRTAAEDDVQGITLEEMSAFITRSGCARVLVQDELRRQLTSPASTGVSCLKLPSRHLTHHHHHKTQRANNKASPSAFDPATLKPKGPSPSASSAMPSSGASSTSAATARLAHPNRPVTHRGSASATPEPSPTNHVVLGSHQTSLTLRAGDLYYTNRHGHQVFLGRVLAVEPHPTRPHILHILHEEPPAAKMSVRGLRVSYSGTPTAKMLVLSLSDVLRDNLHELLDFLLFTDEGKHTLAADYDAPDYDAPNDVMLKKEDTVPTSRRAPASPSAGVFQDPKTPTKTPPKIAKSTSAPARSTDD